MERLGRDHAEAARPRRDGLVEADNRLVRKTHVLQREIPLDGEERDESQGEQVEREPQDDARVERKAAARARNPVQELKGAEVVYDEKADTAENRLDAHRYDGPAARELRKRVGLKAEASVAEAHYRVEYRLVPISEMRVERNGENALYNEHRADDPADEAPEPLNLPDPVGVHKRKLANERNAPPYRDEEESAAGHEPKAPELNEYHQDHLAGNGEFAPDVDDGEPRHAHGRKRREERRDPVSAHVVCAAAWKREDDRADRDQREKAEREGNAAFHFPKVPFSLSHTIQMDSS